MTFVILNDRDKVQNLNKMTKFASVVNAKAIFRLNIIPYQTLIIYETSLLLMLQ